MRKKVLSLLMLVLAFAGASSLAPSAYAQGMPPMQELPLKEGVKAGVLPNGLHYYVLHNAEPKERANFYIAQKVGSTLETPEQLGLAHFLEHMAFNGTKTYPGKDLLNYLQSKGIRFGADINAYTSFDETVYNINNVPTTDLALMDSCLLALRDWSCNILLEETEINAERGVIQEEWRQRNNAQTRMFTKILPEIYEEYQYEQMPIGSMDVVMNFKPQALRDYYQKWYRPDQQGIIVVGDFDADVMEQKVVELFSAIPMPENAAERVYPKVSDNAEPIYVSFEDPELQQTQIMVSFKYDRIPFEYRNTDFAYFNNGLIHDVISTLLNNRLSEYLSNPDCKYAFAQCGFGTFYVSSTKDAFMVVIIAKDDVESAYNDAMSIVARALKTGFTDSELERADSEILAAYEKRYNERDKTDSDALGSELIRHFIDNEPMPGAEWEYQTLSQVLPTLPAAAINEYCASILTPENRVIVVSRPASENPMPSRETMTQALDNIINAEYTAYVDEVITDPLIMNMPKPGKIKSEKKNDKFGTTEYMLSNGVKVVVKSTDYSADQILLSMYCENGKKFFPASQADNVLMLEDCVDLSNLGNFDVAKIRKYLAGKNVSLKTQVGISTLSFEGSSSVKDLQTLLEILYSTMVELQPNEEQYNTYLERAKPRLRLQENNPQFTFFNNISKTVWGGNPVMQQVTINTVENAKYAEMYKMVKDLTSNAANYTLVLAGNVDLDTLRPLLEQYIASMPSKGKKVVGKIENPCAIITGVANSEQTVESQTPSVLVYENLNGDNLKYDIRNQALLDLFGDVLDNNFITTLREEEGGTYGAQVEAQMLPASGQWQLGYFFQTNKEMAEKLIERAHNEALELMKTGTNAEEFNKVKQAMLAQHDINVRTNEYWQHNLVGVERGFDMITGYREIIDAITLEDFNKFAADFYNGRDRIQIVVNCVTEE